MSSKMTSSVSGVAVDLEWTKYEQNDAHLHFSPCAFINEVPAVQTAHSALTLYIQPQILNNGV